MAIATLDPRLRAALRAGLALGPATRLLAFGTAALDAGDAAAVAHLAVVGPDPAGAPPCAVVADPLRLPFVAALFDAVIVTGVLEQSDAPGPLLRELRRIAAPAATVMVVAPRRRLSLNPLPGQHFSRARLDRLLASAMFEPLDWATFGAAYLVRARPLGGPAPAVRRDAVTVRSRVAAA